MSSFIYAATSLIGGAAGALDKIDGAYLADGDAAITIVTGDSCYFHILDADSGAAESSPAVISPDTNAGTKRWIQVGVSGAVAFATWQEIASGVETAKAVAPAQLEDSGVLAPPFATAAEITAGVVSNKTIAPDQLKAATIVPIVYASGTEIAAGTVADKPIAPDQLASALATTGSGKIVRTTSPTITSPTLVTPALGTPASGDLSNCTVTGASLTAALLAHLSVIYPIGCIYTTTVATNPATVFGFGTWTAFGAGRVLVGNGTSDTTFTAGEVGGKSSHILTTAEIPSHSHSVPLVASSNNGGGGSAGSWQGSGMTTGSTGGGVAHTNLQPYIVVYFWRRIA